LTKAGDTKPPNNVVVATVGYSGIKQNSCFVIKQQLYGATPCLAGDLLLLHTFDQIVHQLTFLTCRIPLIQMVRHEKQNRFLSKTPTNAIEHEQG
jgi:hypothetical protein